MKLTDTQLVLLSTASQRDDGAVVLAPNLRGGAASKVVGKLLHQDAVVVRETAEQILKAGKLKLRTLTAVRAKMRRQDLSPRRGKS